MNAIRLKLAIRHPELSDRLEKGFGSDLQKRFPNGSWKTINGARVFVDGGKVVAGLEGFNGKIDSFFKEKKESKQEKLKNDIQNLEERISKIKDGKTLAQLKKDDIKSFYTVKGLSSKLSELKAEQKGNFVTKEHLTEYKNLIIWALKNKVNYRGNLNLKDAMTNILKKVESGEITFKTKKGIKKKILNLTVREGLENTEKNLRKNLGLPVTTNYSDNPVLRDFQQHRLNVLMDF